MTAGKDQSNRFLEGEDNIPSSWYTRTDKFHAEKISQGNSCRHVNAKNVGFIRIWCGFSIQYLVLYEDVPKEIWTIVKGGDGSEL